MTRFELPEETKSLAMPTEERVGLEDEDGFLPVLHAAREEDQPETIGWRKGRLLDWAVKDDELLAEQGILGDEIGFTARKVYRSTEHNRVTGELGEMEKGVFEERNQTDDELCEQVKMGEHAG
jgi:hypothetical protein